MEAREDIYHIEKYPSGGAEYPGCHVTDPSQQDTRGHPYEGEDGGEDVVEDGLSHRHACLQ